MPMSPPKKKPGSLGLASHIVADPEICHGQLTFKGTRIMVHQVLEQLAAGMSWEEISEEWRGAVGHEAIAEALRLASDSLFNQSTPARHEAVPA